MFLDKVFSVKNEDMHKVITFMGIKLKVKRKVKNQVYSVKKLTAYVEQLKFIVDTCCDITKCRPATGNLRLAQKFKAKILKYITDEFEAHNIKYWADGGTLLGAYRHKGFIPWDDDIDLATDRANYDLMKDLFAGELKDNGFTVEYGTGRTAFFMKVFFHGYDVLDVFVYDYSDNGCSREELFEKWSEARIAFYEKYKPADLWNGKIKFDNTFEDMYKIYQEYNLQTGSNNSERWLFKGFDAATKNIYCNIFSVHDIFPMQKVSFDDYEVWAPNNILVYLQTVNGGQYGDIMSFPPLSGTHILKVDEYKNDEIANLIKDLEFKFNEYIASKK